MKHIYTSVDIGSDTIKIVVCELLKNKLNLLAASSVKSKGIKKGLITNFEEAQSSLRLAISKIEDMLGAKIAHAIVSVPSYFADYSMIKGSINVLTDDHIIVGKDVDKVIESAIASHELSGKSIITTVPIDFSVDNEERILDPKGLNGEILSMRGIMVTTPKKNLYSVLNLFDSLGIEVDDVSINGIGDYYSLKNDNMDALVGSIVNVGSETTTISLFNKGVIVKSSILQNGGKNIDNDLSYIYKIPLDDACEMKEKFTLAHKKNASVNDVCMVTTTSGKTRKVNQYEASEVVMARLEQILNSAKKEISALTNRKLDYIILTGGTSNMTHFNYIVDDVLGKSATVGSIKLIGVRNNKYSSAIGNILYFVSRLRLNGSSYTMFKKNEIEELGSNRTSNSNDSMLSKVFGYFFGE
ncbi:MAG: cell division protein FtsA [Bacilli bacterium]|nr:cell division protein FtsA [Bacilli bacterium]